MPRKQCISGSERREREKERIYAKSRPAGDSALTVSRTGFEEGFAYC